MELKWWPVFAVAVVALLVVLIVAVIWPLPRTARTLRPLAHLSRLTELPAYKRIARIRFWSLIVTTVLLAILFFAAAITAARPVGFASATRDFENQHPEDIMLCIGQPVTDAATAGFLDHYAQQMTSFTTERIGLTSPTLRVVPMTRDYVYAKQRFTDLAKLAAERRDLDAKKQITGTEVDALNAKINDFSRTIEYTDYAPSLEDVLALCLTGFPSFEDHSTRRRALIYLGYTDLRGAGETRPPLFSTQQIKDMAAKAGVQVNGIARTDVVGTDPHANDALAEITKASGGRFDVYNPAGTATAGQTDPTLGAILDQIRDNPPAVVSPSGVLLTQRSWDYPNPALLVAIAVAAVLSGSLAVLRR